MSNQQLATDFKNKGNEAFKAKRYQQAIEHFSKAIQLNPKDHVFYSNRSGAYLNNSQLDQALQDAETCIKINPSWPRGYQRKGTALFYQGQHQQAINTYREGLKFDPNNAELLKNIQDAQKKLQQQEGDNGNMMNVFNTILSDPELSGYLQDPTFIPILSSIMSNPAEALKHMGDPRVQKIFQAIQKKTNPADLEKMKQKYASKFPGAQQPNKCPEGDHFHGEHQHKQEPKKEETQTAPPKKESYSQPPPPPPKKPESKPEKMDVQDPAEDLKNQGNEEFKKKNFQAALNYYEQAIQTNPNEPLYYNNKAAAYIQLKDYGSALQQIAHAEKLFDQGVVKDFVKRAKVLARKGTIYAKQENYTESIEAFQKSLLQDGNQKVKDELNKIKKHKKEKDAKEYINPELADKHNQQGSTLYKEGKFPLALKQYEEAIRRNPDNAKYYSNIGQVYIKLMEFQRAKENYQLALKKDPNFQKAYHKKGDCHFFIKQYHKALESYEAGLKRDPEDKFCKEGVEKTQAAIYMGSNSQDQEERAKRAMADPEIQAILQTPEVRNALAEMQRDPKSIQNVMKNKSLAEKIEKLIAAGVLRMG